ncbi:MAG: sulfonate ABC transporter substrate-binding protein [Polynucleobacter sp.]
MHSVKLSYLLRGFKALVISGLFAISSAYADAPNTLRIGYQKSSSILTLLKADGSFEKQLAAKGVDVKWVEFPAGPQLLEGLNVGSIDFGYVGEAPPIFAQAAGASFIYVGYQTPAPKAEAILVPKDSAIKKVGDLRGKKIALNKGSNVHYLLIKVLEKNGLKYSDVQPVFLAPADARAAFEKGSIDAWAIWDPFQAAAEIQISAKELANGVGVVNNLSYFLASRTYAEKNPLILKALFKAIAEQGIWIVKNRKAAAEALAPIQGLSPEIIELSLSRYNHDILPINPKVLAEQQKLADVFYELKLIPKPIIVKDAVIPTEKAK